MGDQIDRREMTHIPVSSGEGCVPKLLLDDRNRYAFHHQLIGMGVTQAMRMDTLLDVSLVREAGHEGSQVGRVERFALEGAEQRCVPVDAKSVSCFDPAAEDRHRTGVEADDPSTVALAVKDSERPCGEIQVLGSQRKRFACSEAAAVHRRR